MLDSELQKFSYFSYKILPSFSIDSLNSSCMSRSRFTISYSRRVLVSSSTSNANLAKSPPVTAISISLVLLKSPLALEPKRITFSISYFCARFRISSITSGLIPVSSFYKPHIPMFISSVLSYHIILSFLSLSDNFRNYFLHIKRRGCRLIPHFGILSSNLKGSL